MSLYQYQEITEPVSVVFEPPPDPGLPVSALEPVRITFTRRRQYVAYTAPVLVPFSAEVFQPQFLSWKSIYPDRVPGLPRNNGLYTRSVGVTPRLPEMTTWYQPASEPVRVRAPRRNDLGANPPWATVERPILLMEWFRQATEPVRALPRWTFMYPATADQDIGQPLPRQESWDVYRPEPVRRARQHLYGFPFDVRTELELPPPVVPDLSTWFQPTPEFVRGRRPTHLAGPSLSWHSTTGPNVVEDILGRITRPTLPVWPTIATSLIFSVLEGAQYVASLR